MSLYFAQKIKKRVLCVVSKELNDTDQIILSEVAAVDTIWEIDDETTPWELSHRNVSIQEHIIMFSAISSGNFSLTHLLCHLRSPGLLDLAVRNKDTLPKGFQGM